MPYNTEDHAEWANEAGWREAAQYRGREVISGYWEYDTNGYFTVEDDADVQLLKSILAAGYCVQTVIRATSPGLFDEFDTNDVVSGYTEGPMDTDHAQTIVGYKEGAEWNPVDPDG
jgi:hypothetical protein